MACWHQEPTLDNHHSDDEKENSLEFHLKICSQMNDETSYRKMNQPFLYDQILNIMVNKIDI